MTPLDCDLSQQDRRVGNAAAKGMGGPASSSVLVTGDVVGQIAGLGGAEVPIPTSRHNDRRCVATGDALPPGSPAIRFVRGPDGVAVPDLAAKLPGRGAWVSPTRDAVMVAAKRGFSRSFRAETKTSDDPAAFADRIGDLLAERALRSLGLARRAGQLFTGFEAVSKRAGDLAAYLSPSDASEDGVSKIAGRVAAAGTASHIRVPTEAAILAAAIGEPAAVHIGLARGRAGLSAAEAAAIWAAYTRS